MVFTQQLLVEQSTEHQPVVYKHKQKDSDSRLSLEILWVFGYLNLLGFGNFNIYVLKVIILFFLDDLWSKNKLELNY